MMNNTNWTLIKKNNQIYQVGFYIIIYKKILKICSVSGDLKFENNDKICYILKNIPDQFNLNQFISYNILF